MQMDNIQIFQLAAELFMKTVIIFNKEVIGYNKLVVIATVKAQLINCR